MLVAGADAPILALRASCCYQASRSGLALAGGQAAWPASGGLAGPAGGVPRAAGAGRLGRRAAWPAGRRAAGGLAGGRLGRPAGVPRAAWPAGGLAGRRAAGAGTTVDRWARRGTPNDPLSAPHLRLMARAPRFLLLLDGRVPAGKTADVQAPPGVPERPLSGCQRAAQRFFAVICITAGHLGLHDLVTAARKRVREEPRPSSAPISVRRSGSGGAAGSVPSISSASGTSVAVLTTGGATSR
jgi:hypothetical protein